MGSDREALRHGVQIPLSRNALEPVCAALGEGETGARHEVSDRTRDEHLAGLGLRHHPCADVDGDAAQLFGSSLTFAGVDTGAHLETQLADPFADALCAAHRARGAVEAGEEAIARGVLSTPR